jgi:hypothetical protein
MSAAGADQVPAMWRACLADDREVAHRVSPLARMARISLWGAKSLLFL